MRLENTLSVPATVDEVWAVLNDVPRVIPCMPGAQLDHVVDENTWEATMRVRLGPVSLEFSATINRESIDESARRVALLASAREQRGRGGARGKIESYLVEDDSGTRVDIVTELNLEGRVAQYGRGIIPEVAAQLTKDFADCLARQLSTDSTEAAPEAPGPEGTKPVRGLHVLVGAIARSALRWLRRQ